VRGNYTEGVGEYEPRVVATLGLLSLENSTLDESESEGLDMETTDELSS
jgi:hypothetical protein